MDQIESWMTWRNPRGLETPAPAGEFMGGAATMVAGQKDYITVNIPPGDYAFLSEGLNLSERNLIYTFTVPGE